MVSAAVEPSQMASDEVKAQIEENVLAQIEQLVQQNVESYLASDETVAAKLAMAQTAYDSLFRVESPAGSGEYLRSQVYRHITAWHGPSGIRERHSFILA